MGYQQVTEIFGFNRNKESKVVSTSLSATKLESKQIKKKEKTLVVKPLLDEEVVENEVNQVVYFPGEGQDTVTEQAKEKEYSYIAPNTGIYYFELLDIKQGSYLDVDLLDESGKQIAQLDMQGKGVELEAGKTYKIKVARSGSDLSYRLKVTVAKKILDISKGTTVKDSIVFPGQANIYSYTVARNGSYHFELSDVVAGSSFEVYVLDGLGNKLDRVGYEGFTFELKEHETYTLGVRHYSSYELSNYTLNIGVQKPIEKVDDYTKVKDSIEFIDQVNHYTFKAPEKGIYGFGITDKMADTDISVVISNKLKEELGKISSYQSSTTVALEKDEEYVISVHQEKGLTNYILKIGYAKPERDILQETTLTDEMSFSKEVHNYRFIPSATSSYSISLTNDVADIAVLDEYDNPISGNYRNEFELNKGKKYTIQLIQNGDLGKYEININKMKE